MSKASNVQKAARPTPMPEETADWGERKGLVAALPFATMNTIAQAVQSAQDWRQELQLHEMVSNTAALQAFLDAWYTAYDARKAKVAAQMQAVQSFLSQEHACLLRLSGATYLPAFVLAAAASDLSFAPPGATFLEGYIPGPTSPDAAAWRHIAGWTQEAAWESVWRALLLVRLSLAGALPPLRGQRKETVDPLLSLLKLARKQQHIWSRVHTYAVADIAATRERALLTVDLLEVIASALTRQGRTLWLVLSDLEGGVFKSASQYREAITGLVDLVAALDARQASPLRPLLCIQESVWEQLPSDKKSVFTGRDLRID